MSAREDRAQRIAFAFDVFRAQAEKKIDLPRLGAVREILQLADAIMTPEDFGASSVPAPAAVPADEIRALAERHESRRKGRVMACDNCALLEARLAAEKEARERAEAVADTIMVSTREPLARKLEMIREYIRRREAERDAEMRRAEELQRALATERYEHRATVEQRDRARDGAEAVEREVERQGKIARGEIERQRLIILRNAQDWEGLRAQHAAAERREGALREALRKTIVYLAEQEWSAWRSADYGKTDFVGSDCCPECAGMKADGHLGSCALAGLLAYLRALAAAEEVGNHGS